MKSARLGLLVALLVVLGLLIYQANLLAALRRSVAAPDEHARLVAAIERAQADLAQGRRRQAEAKARTARPDPAKYWAGIWRNWVPDKSGEAAYASLGDPEYRRLLREKSLADTRQAALADIALLKLGPEAAAKYLALKLEYRETKLDFVFAAYDQQMRASNPSDLRKMQPVMHSTLDPITAQINATIGTDGVAKLSAAAATSCEQDTAKMLQQTLSYAGTALTADQSAQLVAVLAAHPVAAAPKAMTAVLDPSGEIRMSQGGSWGEATQADGTRLSPARISDEALAAAASFLSADQLAALRQQQAFLHSQLELGRLMSELQPEAAAAAK